MGMFDYLAWKDPLPLEFNGEKINLSFSSDEEPWFQTKDFNNGMDLYIVKDRKLFIEKVERQWVDDKESGSIFGGYMEEVSRQTFFHGITQTVNFYHYMQNYDDKNDAWVEFQVIFVEGIVKSITLVKFEKQSNADRKRVEESHRKKLEKEKELLSKKYFFLISSYRFCLRRLARFIRFMGDAISSFGNYLIVLSYKIY